MSEYSEKYNAYNAKAKVAHYCRKSDGQVDASAYEVPGELDTEEKVNRFPKESITTPPRKPRKAGGRVGGEEAKHNAGRSKRGGNWIAGAVKHKGALHKELGVPEGKKIPEKKLEKAEHSDNPVERKRANLAETLKKMHKASGGGVAPEVSGTRPTGGRIAKASGGRAKGKTNINIVIAQPQSQPPMPAPGGPMGAPPPLPVNPARTMGMAPTGGPGNMPPPSMQGPPPPMMRKAGGRVHKLVGGPAMGPHPAPNPGPGPHMHGQPMNAAPQASPMGMGATGLPWAPGQYYGNPQIGAARGGKIYPDMDHAAGGGLGRLEKAKKYGP